MHAEGDQFRHAAAGSPIGPLSYSRGCWRPELRLQMLLYKTPWPRPLRSGAEAGLALATYSNALRQTASRFHI